MIVFSLAGHPRDVSPSALPLAAARAGDRAAIDTVVAWAAPLVIGWCRRVGGRTVHADDAAQDVLVVLYTRISQVPDTIRPWLWGVTRRVLAAHRRRAWVRRWLPGLRADPVDPTPDVVRRLESDDALRFVDATLAGMPLAQREVFVLCDIEGHTDEEAAEITRASVGTTKSRLRLARARFAACLQEDAASSLAAEAP